MKIVDKPFVLKDVSGPKLTFNAPNFHFTNTNSNKHSRRRKLLSISRNLLFSDQWIGFTSYGFKRFGSCVL